MINLGTLMFLVIFIYAVIGVNLFAEVKLSPPMSHHINFQSVSSSFLLLIRLLTGEAWNDLMNGLSLPYSITHQCIDSPTYGEFAANDYKPVGCGNYLQTYIYFYSYLLIVATTFLNLFIAIVLDGYFNTVENEK